MTRSISGPLLIVLALLLGVLIGWIVRARRAAAAAAAQTPADTTPADTTPADTTPADTTPAVTTPAGSATPSRPAEPAALFQQDPPVPGPRPGPDDNHLAAPAPEPVTPDRAPDAGSAAEPAQGRQDTPARWSATGPTVAAPPARDFTRSDDENPAEPARPTSDPHPYTRTTAATRGTADRSEPAATAPPAPVTTTGPAAEPASGAGRNDAHTHADQPARPDVESVSGSEEHTRRPTVEPSPWATTPRKVVNRDATPPTTGDPHVTGAKNTAVGATSAPQRASTVAPPPADIPVVRIESPAAAATGPTAEVTAKTPVVADAPAEPTADTEAHASDDTEAHASAGAVADTRAEVAAHTPAEVGAVAAGGATAADDFRRLAGVGPKVASALHAAGIHTFAQLADAEPAILREAMRQAGVRSAPTLASWPEQARALAR